MKHILITTIAAVLLVGCVTIQSIEPTTVKVPDISIWQAAQTGNTEALKQHLFAGADVNAKTKSGTTPLHLAAWKGHKVTAELLIAKGANENAKMVDGRTPLDAAIYGKNPETADLLRKHGGKTGEELKAEGK